MSDRLNISTFINKCHHRLCCEWKTLPSWSCHTSDRPPSTTGNTGGHCLQLVSLALPLSNQEFVFSHTHLWSNQPLQQILPNNWENGEGLHRTRVGQCCIQDGNKYCVIVFRLIACINMSTLTALVSELNLYSVFLTDLIKSLPYFHILSNKLNIVFLLLHFRIPILKPVPLLYWDVTVLIHDNLIIFWSKE